MSLSLQASGLPPTAHIVVEELFDLYSIERLRYDGKYVGCFQSWHHIVITSCHTRMGREERDECVEFSHHDFPLPLITHVWLNRAVARFKKMGGPKIMLISCVEFSTVSSAYILTQ